MLLSKQIAILLMVMSSFLVIYGKPTTDHCTTCQNLSKFVREMETNQTESAMRMNFYQMCLKENEGSNSRVCIFLASTLQNTLKHISDADFCSKINACTTNKQLDKAANVNEERCEFCTDLVDSFKSLIADNNADSFKESMNQYCEWAGDYKSKCLSNLNNNLVSYVDFIQNQLNGELFCHAIRSCHHQTIDEKQRPVMGDLLSLRDPVQMSTHFDHIQQQEGKLNDLNNPVTCVICRQLITIIYSQLHKNATRENVESQLAKACKAIFFRNKDKERECEERVIKNAELILKSFINKVPPELVCVLSGMCLAHESNNPINKSKVDSNLEVDTSLTFERRIVPQNWNQDFKCYFCEKVVDFVFKELDTKKTRVYVKHLLERSCGRLFQNEDKEARCEEYVDAYTDKLIDLIEKTENPGLICNALHMCAINSTKTREYDLRKLSRSIQSDTSLNRQYNLDWCNACHLVYPALHKAVQNNDAEERLRSMAHLFCNADVLPIDAANCTEKADEYLNVIATVKDSQQGCTQLNVCPADRIFVSVFNSKELGEDIKCTACKLLIKDAYHNLNHTVNDPKTKESISHACERIPEVEIKNRCKQDAYKMLVEIVRDLEHNLPPEKACELLEQCKRKNTVGYLSTSNVIPSAACVTCKSVYPMLHQALQNQQFRESILVMIDRMCQKSSKPEDCRRINIELVNNIANSNDCQTGCKSVCSNKNEEVSYSKMLSSFDKNVDDLLDGTDDLLPSDFEIDQMLNLNGNDNVVCKGCKQFFTRVNEFVRNRKNFKEELLKRLLETCPQDDNKCREFYNKYINFFYDTLVKETSPDVACPTLRLCPDSLNRYLEETENWQPAITIDDDEVGNNPVCKECQSAVSYLIETMKNKKVVDFLLKELTIKVCDPLTFIERKACTKLVKTFGPKLVQRVVSKLNKDKICTDQLKLCPKNQFMLDNWFNEDPTDFVRIFNDPTCAVCLRSVNKLNAKRGETSKRYTVEQICGKDDVECSDFMFNFLEFFYRENANIDSVIACGELDVCMMPGKVQLLGGNEKCNFGPAYSCLSAAHANACKSTKFCQENVWRTVN